MKTVALILNIINLLALLPALAMAMTSPMMFDSGATTRTWILFSLAIAIPISIIITQIASWIFFSKGNYQWSIGLSCIPLALILVLLLMFLVSDKLT